MSSLSTDEFSYNELAIKDAEELLENLENDLYDLDVILYDAIMGISYAQGYSEVYKEDRTLDLSKVEGMVKKIRVDNNNALKSLKNAVNSVQGYLMLNASDVNPTLQNKNKEAISRQAKRIDKSDNTNDNSLKETINKAPAKRINVEKKEITLEKINEKPISMINSNDKKVVSKELKIGSLDKSEIPPVQPVYGVPINPITSDDRPQITPVTIPRPGMGTIPVSRPSLPKAKFVKFTTSPGNSSKPIIPPVQAVYGAPVKPILTSDNKPQFTPVAVPRFSKTNISKQMHDEAIKNSQRHLVERIIKNKKED